MSLFNKKYKHLKPAKHHPKPLPPPMPLPPSKPLPPLIPIPLPKPLPPQKQEEFGFEEDLDLIVSIFSDINHDYVKKLLTENAGHENVNEICEKLSVLDYPKDNSSHSSRSPPPRKKEEDFRNYDRTVSPLHKRLCCSFLSSHYPTLPLSIVMKEASKFKFHLYPTVCSIEENIVYPDLDDKEQTVNFGEEKFSFLPYARQKVFLREEYDDDFRQEVSFVEKELEERNEIRSKEQEYKKFGGELPECPVCANKFPYEHFVQCTEGCLICAKCFAGIVRTGLNAGSLALNCAADQKCKGIYPESFVQRTHQLGHLTDQDVQRLDELRAHELFSNAELLKALGSNLVTCPHCTYKCLMDDPEDLEFICRNSECGKRTCRKCGKTSHPGKKCEKELQSANEELQKFVAAALDRLLVKVCSKCHKQGTLTNGDGCNFISCACGNGYCYYCGKDLPASEHSRKAKHYNRDLNNESCPLWGGIDQARIDQVRSDAVKEWKAAHPGFSDLEAKV